MVPLESEATEDELPSAGLISVFEVIDGKMAGVVGVVESFFAGCAAIIGFGRAGIDGFVFNAGASCGEMADCEPVPRMMGAIPREVGACGAAMVAGIAWMTGTGGLMLPFWSAPVCWLGIVGRVLLVMFGANWPVMMGTCRWEPFSGAPMIGPETVVWLLNTEVGGDTTGAGKGDNGPF